MSVYICVSICVRKRGGDNGRDEKEEGERVNMCDE